MSTYIHWSRGTGAAGTIEGSRFCSIAYLELLSDSSHHLVRNEAHYMGDGTPEECFQTTDPEIRSHIQGNEDGLTKSQWDVLLYAPPSSLISSLIYILRGIVFLAVGHRLRYGLLVK